LRLQLGSELQGNAGGYGRVRQQFPQVAGGHGAAVACGTVLFLCILLTGGIGVGLIEGRGNGAEDWRSSYLHGATSITELDEKQACKSMTTATNSLALWVF
jgi:hypothetical protein